MKQITLLFLMGLLFNQAIGQRTADLNKNRRYDEISWLVNHNAFQNPEINATDLGPGGKNQQHDIRTQLNNGVRSFMIDLQYGRVTNLFKGKFLRLGHGPGGYFHWMEMCDFLKYVKDFLDANRNEIITLHMQIDGGVTTNHIKDAFKGKGNRCNSRADIDHYLYTQTSPNQLWPRLNEMIASNKRLVVLSERNFGSSAPSWLHYEFSYTRQNDFSASQVNDLKQTHRYLINGNPGRGDTRSSLLTINNFATDAPLGYGDGNKSAHANGYSLMHEKLRESWFSFSKRPSMAVDFYERNNFSSMSVMKDANRWNEVRGRFKFSNGANFTGFVFTNSNFNGENPWNIRGAKTQARLHYSFPARLGESRVITFSHPNYNFSPSQINLAAYDGNQKLTFTRDIIVTPKTTKSATTSYEISNKGEDEIRIYRKAINNFEITMSGKPINNGEIDIYDINSKLIGTVRVNPSTNETSMRISVPSRGIYFVKGQLNGKPFTKKIQN
ncbi:hypothetical protein [Aquimarina rhabdastrellae]